VHEARRLDEAARAGAVVPAVGEAQALVVAAGAGDDRERVGVGARAGEGVGHGRGAQRVDAAAQARGEDLLELGQRPDRGLLDPGHAGARRRAQADRDGDRLLLVEQQGRQRGARTEAVAAGDAARGGDRVAEAAQPVHVAADRPRPHVEALGEVGAGPFAAALQEGQELEQTG
jgi:hypothetical protein